MGETFHFKLIGREYTFKQYLTFDDAGQITKQMSQQGSGSWLRQDYFYDDLGQLTQWRKDSGTGYGEFYTYDSVGNRLNLYNENNTGAITSWRNYDIGRRTDTSTGPNQMLKSLSRNFFLIADYTTYEYDSDGAQKRRKLYNSSGTLQLDEKFSYSSWRGLSWKYERTNPNLIGANTWEWRYRYNAMGEREQKRETLNPGGDGTAANGYDWTYYLFGGRQQLAVWKGLQTSDATFCSFPGTSSYTHLYPTEYITYGSSTTSLITKPTTTSSTQEYRIADHLGSSRVVLGSNGSISSTVDYKAFGELLSGTEPRANFIDKERAVENQLGNFGVREYDYSTGRFTSIDPSWESFQRLTPYHYSGNDPLGFLDINGEFPITFHTRGFAPWDWFGRMSILIGASGFKGDGANRRFSTSSSASSRIGSMATVETDNMSLVSSAPYRPSLSVGFSREGFTTKYWSAYSESHVDASMTGNQLLVHTYGNNAAAIGSADIDVDQKLQISVSQNGVNRVLSIFGQVRGDDFPAVESFVQDKKGTRVFLGVGKVQGAYRDFGPFALLWGRGLITRAWVNVQIVVDKQGNFIGVMSNGKMISVEEWNKQFEQTNPTY